MSKAKEPNLVTTSKTRQVSTIPADFSPCLSLGAKYFEILRNRKVDETNSDPLFLLVFELSFKVYKLGVTSLTPIKALLTINLKNGFIALDGAPQMETDIKSIRIKYSYSLKTNDTNQVSFKLGWKGVGNETNSGVSYGETTSQGYETIYETEATIEYCTVQYQNLLSHKPQWVFERKQNERILRGNRKVWLTVGNETNSGPLAGNAILSAEFAIVREREKIIDKLTEDQIRLYDKVVLQSLRKRLLSRNLQRSTEIIINHEIN